jgi:nucleoside-diphosphate-sugar epimerase
MSRALLIGGTGPTGPYLARGLLARGFELAILHRGSHETDAMPPEVEHIHTDPYDGGALRDALGERRFELAIASYGRMREIARVMRGRTARFLGIGGVPLYRGWMLPQDCTPEGLPVPVREDAARVSSVEEFRKGYLVRLSEQAVFEHHPDATVFRYPYVYGPRQLMPREWSVVRRLLDGRPFLILGDGGLTLETAGYAENLAHAVMLAVDAPEVAGGQTYNCGDEQVWTLRQRAETIARLMQRPLEILCLPGPFARPAQPFQTHERTDHRVMDLAKIRRELGYRDVVPVEEGLRRTITWLLENPPEPGGATESILQDTFDYAAEDRLAALHRRHLEELRQVSYERPPGPGLSYTRPEDRARKRGEGGGPAQG